MQQQWTALIHTAATRGLECALVQSPHTEQSTRRSVRLIMMQSLPSRSASLEPGVGCALVQTLRAFS